MTINQDTKDNNMISVIYAGGTFGSFGQPLYSLNPNEFLPILQDILSNQVQNMTTSTTWHILDNPIVKDSSQLTPADFAHFYQCILMAMQSGCRQFVILTGTDTLSYLSSFLAECFVDSDVCIVLTGAMQPLLDTQIIDSFVVNTDSDATINLLQACQFVQQGKSGVWVSFSGENWSAQTVQKIHSHDKMAFIGHQQIGYPSNHYVKQLDWQSRQDWLDKRLATLEITIKKLAMAKIFTLYLVPMMADNLAEQILTLLDKKPHALIFLGFGAGNMPQNLAVQTALQQAYQQGCLSVITTQCPYGGVSTTYEAGAWLDKYQVLSGANLTIPAIFARLLWLVGQGLSIDKQRALWIENL